MGSLKREWGRGEGHQKEKGGRCFGGSIGRRALKEKMGEEKDKELERGGGHSEGKRGKLFWGEYWAESIKRKNGRGKGQGKGLGEGRGTLRRKKGENAGKEERIGRGGWIKRTKHRSFVHLFKGGGVFRGKAPKTVGHERGEDRGRGMEKRAGEGDSGARFGVGQGLGGGRGQSGFWAAVLLARERISSMRPLILSSACCMMWP